MTATVLLSQDGLVQSTCGLTGRLDVEEPDHRNRRVWVSFLFLLAYD